MIDIHSHILPGLDDGASTVEEAVEMAKAAFRSGITTIIATPHHLNGYYVNDVKAVEEAVRQFNQVLVEREIPLKVLKGQEVHVNTTFNELMKDGGFCMLGDSQYLLLELPSASVPQSFADTLDMFIRKGIRPIIAHPERNKILAAKPELLCGFIEQGALCQITAHSVLGLFGKKIRKMSLEWCRSRMVHFIASDAHNPYRRSFALKEAYSTVQREVGVDWSFYYQLNAERVLKNDPIIYVEPELDTSFKLKFWK